MILFIKVKNFFNNVYHSIWIFNSFSSLGVFSISSFKSLSSRLIIFTKILFLSLSFILYKVFRIKIGLGNLKCFWNNSVLIFFLPHSYLITYFEIYIIYLIYFSSFGFLCWGTLDNGKISFLNDITTNSLPWINVLAFFKIFSLDLLCQNFLVCKRPCF